MSDRVWMQACICCGEYTPAPICQVCRTLAEVFTDDWSAAHPQYSTSHYSPHMRAMALGYLQGLIRGIHEAGGLVGEVARQQAVVVLEQLNPVEGAIIRAHLQEVQAT